MSLLQFVPCFLKDLRKGKYLCFKYPLPFALSFSWSGSYGPGPAGVHTEHLVISSHLDSPVLILFVVVVAWWRLAASRKACFHPSSVLCISGSCLLHGKAAVPVLGAVHGRTAHGWHCIVLFCTEDNWPLSSRSCPHLEQLNLFPDDIDISQSPKSVVPYQTSSLKATLNTEQEQAMPNSLLREDLRLLLIMCFPCPVKTPLCYSG